MQANLLIIAPEAVALPIAEALRLGLEANVEVAGNRRSGLACLRRTEYTLVLLDESVGASDSEGADFLYQNASTAPILEMNFAISSASRILRQVRAALTRRAHDHAQARTAVTTALKNELNSSLAGLLLESQLALREATPKTAPKLRYLVELADDLRNRLRLPS